MKSLRIQNVPDALAQALEDERRRRGKSLNETLIELLCQGLGVGTVRSMRLGRLAGSWKEEEFREFEEAVAGLERVDDELWR